MPSQPSQKLIWIDTARTSPYILSDLDSHRIHITRVPAKATILLFESEEKFLEQIKTFVAAKHQLVIIFTNKDEEEGEFEKLYVRKMHPKNFYDWCKTPQEERIVPTQTGIVGMIRRMLGLQKAA